MDNVNCAVNRRQGGSLTDVTESKATGTVYCRSGNFHVKNNLRENFRVVKFSRFRSICEIFLAVDYYNMDEHLESSWRLVYYQVSGEPGIARCSRQSDIYLVECGLARKLSDHRRVILFFVCLIFAVDLDHEIILTAKFSRSTVACICTQRCGSPSVHGESEVHLMIVRFYRRLMLTQWQLMGRWLPWQSGSTLEMHLSSSQHRI